MSNCSRSLPESFGYWTNCAVASYEVAKSKKSFPKNELKRLESIAQGMIWDGDKYGVKGNSEFEHARERFTAAKESVP